LLGDKSCGADHELCTALMQRRARLRLGHAGFTDIGLPHFARDFLDELLLWRDRVVIEQKLRPLLGAVQNADDEHDIVPNRVNDDVR
jgi:hypothetical protein